MTSISTLGQNDFIRSQVMKIQTQLNTLSAQVSSGNKSQTFSGINDVTQLSLQLNDQQSLTQSYISNINNAQTRIAPIQAVLQRITEVANQLRNDALTASSGASLPTVKGNGALQAEAESALNEIGSLLNSKMGTDYLFGGRITSTPPMASFGTASNAASVVGQVTNVGANLTNTAGSGDAIYEAITAYLNNNVTRTTAQGGSAPAPYGYAGETGQPGGSTYALTLDPTVTAPVVGDTTITVAQSLDLPQAGDYIEFATLPPTNAAYQVTGVNVATRQITFARQINGVPLGAPPTGLDANIPLGTAINVTRPTAVTTVAVSSPQTTDSVAGAAAAGATQFTVTTPANYKVGDRIQISSLPGDFYNVTAVDATTSSVTVSLVPGGGGLSGPIAATDTTTIDHGYAPGTNIITLGSNANVTAGMTVKFSDSNVTYTVAQVIGTTQIQIVAEGASSGAGLAVPLYAPEPGATILGQEVTASFGPPVPPLSVAIDNAVNLSYGIRADNPAIRTVLNAIFALAGTNLSATTDAGFREIASRAAADLALGSQAVTTIASNLGVKQQTLQATEDRHTSFQTAIQTQLSGIQDVDMTEAITRLTQTQTQLQASFQLLSSLKSLTLSNYI
jgi:flagellar hook-associated protein 3 FlgL